MRPYETEARSLTSFASRAERGHFGGLRVAGILSLWSPSLYGVGVRLLVLLQAVGSSS